MGDEFCVFWGKGDLGVWGFGYLKSPIWWLNEPEHLCEFLAHYLWTQFFSSILPVVLWFSDVFWFWWFLGIWNFFWWRFRLCVLGFMIEKLWARFFSAWKVVDLRYFFWGFWGHYEIFLAFTDFFWVFLGFIWTYLSVCFVLLFLESLLRWLMNRIWVGMNFWMLFDWRGFCVWWVFWVTREYIFCWG